MWSKCVRIISRKKHRFYGFLRLSMSKWRQLIRAYCPLVASFVSVWLRWANYIQYLDSKICLKMSKDWNIPILNFEVPPFVEATQLYTYATVCICVLIFQLCFGLVNFQACSFSPNHSPPRNRNFQRTWWLSKRRRRMSWIWSLLGMSESQPGNISHWPKCFKHQAANWCIMLYIYI